MSLKIFSKNLKYLRKKKNMKGTEVVEAVNKMLRMKFKVSDDKLINRQRYGAYEEGRCYCPAYLLPIFCKILDVKDSLLLFTTDIEQADINETSQKP